MIENLVVSVVIPYSPDHTPKKMLKEAVRSVNKQNIRTNINIVKDNNQKGPAWARNRGLDLADTRYVAFLDADDLWNDNKLARQLNRLKQTNTGICIEADYCSTNMFMRDLFLERVSSITSSILIDTQKVSVQFETELKRWEDHLFVLEAANKAGACFCRDLVQIRKHSKGLSSRNTTELVLDQRKKFHQYVAQRVDETLVEDNEDIVYQNMYYHLGIKNRRRGDFSLATNYFSNSLLYKFSFRSAFFYILSLAGENFSPWLDPVFSFSIPIRLGLNILKEEGIIAFTYKLIYYFSSSD